MKQLIVFLSLLCVSCGGGSTPQIRKTPSVKCALAQSNAYVVKDFVGLSTPDKAVNLAFKISGQILSLPVSTGMEVQRDRLLAELDPRDYELQLSADRSTFEQAKSKFERVKRLLAHEAVSRQEYELSESEYVRARSTYENSKEILAQTKLRAPFGALVERVYVDTYQRVASGETIMRMVSPTSTTVEFTLPESSLGALSDSTTLFEVTFNAYGDVVFDAKIKEYARTTSDASGFPVALTITDTKGYTIQSGMSCTITMLIYQGGTNTVTLPLSAIYAPAEGGDYVWVVGDRSEVELTAVVLGDLVGEDRIVVKSGVAPKSRVVVAGVYQLRDGQKVKVLSR
ncbi:MAG: efflux RND transporter periplasmic adaptor subunit [Rikenellaceae bacterium]